MGSLAYIQVEFDPVLRLGELALRWQTVGVAIALIVGVAMAAHGRAQPRPPPAPPPAQRRSSGLPPAPDAMRGAALVEAKPLRLDEMAFILLASVPGAVLGGRLVHGLVFGYAYREAPERLLDPAFGSLSLLGAVLGGTLTAVIMARLLGAPVQRWVDAAALPLLVTLGLGKLAQLLGGSGQGAHSTGPWAVAFTGEGPWVSPNPSLPAHPAQIYEGAWLLVGAILVASLAGVVRKRPTETGTLFLVAIVTFLLGRLVVGFSWRDPAVVGPLNAEQALAAIGLAGSLLGYGYARAGRGIVEGGTDTTEAARSREERRR